MTCCNTRLPIRNVKHISSLNIRISREIKGCSEKIINHIYSKNKINNTLILSPPQCGKTTLLRDIVRNLSDGDYTLGRKGVKVCLVDERNEISGSYLGVPQMDIGLRTDVIETCPKNIAIMMMLRSMSPNVIVTDEIGSTEDIEAMYTALSGDSVLLISMI